MDTVQVLMSTYNGDKYLEEQLNSLISQKDVNVKILVRDDGSTDNTTKILDEWKAKGVLEWYTGPNLKPALSFMDLIYNAPACEFYAFCDQDDYWKSNKLISAVEKIKKHSQTKPILYTSPTELVDENLNSLNVKSKSVHGDTVEQCIICSNATGCTEVFNYELLKLAKHCRPKNIGMHDGWIHKICLAMDGILIRDDESYILYRQHGDNVVGGTSTFCKKMKRRFKTVFSGNMPRSTVIKELYENYKDIMPEKNKELLYLAANYKTIKNGRFKIILNKKIRTGNRNIDFMCMIAILLGVY